MPDSIDKLLQLEFNKTFTISGINHEVGNQDCSACSDGILGPCFACEGLVHLQVIDSYKEVYIQKCDVCRK